MSRNHDLPVSVLSTGPVSERIFSAASGHALRQIADGHSPEEYPGGATLFQEGEPGQGVFLLLQGAVKLYVGSSHGDRLLLRTVNPGELLGLSASLTGQEQEVTAETAGPSKLVFIPRKDFLRFLRTHSDVCLRVVESLSNDVHVAYERVRMLGLSRIRHQHN
jgi:CRP-like cAMP-binding protein